jgi:hypothetical protein
MTIQLPHTVINFAAGDSARLGFFGEFKDYWNQYRSENGPKGKHYAFSTVDAENKPISFIEKEALLNAHLKREIGKLAGVDFSTMPMEQWVSNPQVKWATFAFVDQMIDSVLPDTIIDSIGSFCDVRTGDFGSTFLFDIKPRDLFAVSKSGFGMRSAEVHKQYNGQVPVNPEMHQIAVGVNLYRVLLGLDSLAWFTAKAVKSMETQMAREVYDAFSTAMLALSSSPASTALQVSGYSQDTLADLSQKVEAWSGGASPLVLGTRRALAKVLPDDANYRYDLESDFVKLGYLREISGVNTFELPQIADWASPFATVLSNSYLYIIAPGTDKLVKLCLEGGTISNTTENFGQATLTMDTNIWKKWKAAVVTSSVAAVIDL